MGECKKNLSEMISHNENFRNKQLIGNIILKVKESWSLKKNSTSIEEHEHFQKQIDAYFEIIKEEILKPRPSFVKTIPNEPGADDAAELRNILRYLYITWDDENLRNKFYNFFGIKRLKKLFPLSKKEKLKFAMYSVIIVLLSLVLVVVLFWTFSGLKNY